MNQSHLQDDPYEAEAVRLDLARGMTPSSLLSACVIFFVGTVTLALFNAQGLSKWAQKLPEHSISEWLILASFSWQDAMEALGTAHVFEQVRQAFYAFRALGAGG